MLKEGDICRIKDPKNGKYEEPLLTVEQIDGEYALVAINKEKYGEFSWIIKLYVSELEAGEVRWTPFATWEEGSAGFSCSICKDGKSQNGEEHFCANCGAKIRK